LTHVDAFRTTGNGRGAFLSLIEFIRGAMVINGVISALARSESRRVAAARIRFPTTDTHCIVKNEFGAVVPFEERKDMEELFQVANARSGKEMRLFGNVDQNIDSAEFACPT
jgi:hypothetical protein